MYIELAEKIVLRQFLVYEFYGVETCFCWDTDKLVIFPYTKDESTARDIRVLSTPNPIRKIQCYDGRVFLACVPQGVYKLSRNKEFAILSKNALAMGAQFWDVIVAYRNGIYLDNKQTKSSSLLFHCSFESEITEQVHALPLDLENTETQFVDCLIANCETEQNLCVLAHVQKLFVLVRNTVQLVYTSDTIIVDIAFVKRGNKIAGLLLHLKDVDTVILVHSKNGNLAFEKVHLERNTRSVSALCAGFSLQVENVMWIVYSDQSRTYYMRKDLLSEMIHQTRVDERTFTCMQHYKADVILGLSQKNELIEFSLEKLDSFLLVNNNIDLCTNMFQKTDIIMEKICAKVKQLNVLYENLTDEQDRLKRINLYASKQRLKINPLIEVSRLCNYRYLTLSIPTKLPKNSHVMFTFASKNYSTLCIKKVTDTMFTIKMPINENKLLCSSTISMDLITLMDEQYPWCLIKDFINYPSQNIKRKREEQRKRGPKRDMTIFIDTKIMSLQNLIEDKDLNITKLQEIKKVVRAELY